MLMNVPMLLHVHLAVQAHGTSPRFTPKENWA